MTSSNTRSGLIPDLIKQTALRKMKAKQTHHDKGQRAHYEKLLSRKRLSTLLEKLTKGVETGESKN
jgi:hypothetical protein